MTTERRFYCEQIQLGPLPLSGDESHHARNVLRVRKGDPIVLFDGEGSRAEAVIETVSRDGVSVVVKRIEEPKQEDRPLPVTVAVAMPKPPRQDALIEKCTELGAQAIWAVATHRSVLRPGVRRMDHWRRISISAAKQTGQLYLPEIPAPKTFEQVLDYFGQFDVIVFGSTESEPQPLLDCLASRPPVTRALVVIGPEGGFTPEERAALTKAGALPVSLGRWTLRVETAATTALGIVAAWIDRSESPTPRR